MNKTLKILLCFLAMILSLGTTFLVIGYEKEKKVSDELVMADNYENNVLTANNDSLTTLEKVIIYIAIVIFIFSLLTLITFLIKIEGIWTSHYYRVVYLLLIFILSSLTSQTVIYFTNKNILMTNHNGKNQSYSSYIVSPKGIKVLENNISLANENYYGNKKDTNVILIKNGSQVTLDNFVIRKVSDSNNIKIAKIYGINAAILVLKDSQLSLKKSNIETSDNGSVGLCAALKNANISVENTNINTSGDNSFGILGSFDSHIDVNYTNIKTGSTYSSAINAIKNSQINVNNALLETNGNNSPIITTDSIIKINNSTGDANSSYLALVEENGNLSIKNSNFRASALHMSDEEDAGILIKRNTSISNYQEKSIVDISNSTLEIKDQSKVYNSAPMFNIKNANTTINIEDTILNFGSKVLFKITNNNAERFRKIIRVVINAKKQTLNGNILLDKRSTLEFNLVNSTFKGNINKNNKAKKLVVNIDSSSTLSLTDDSYITIFNDEDKEFTNIKTNGHILYYSKKYNPSLKEQTFELDDGGKIKGI